VTITGTNLTGVTKVQFGGVDATNLTGNTATSITARVPATAPASSTIAVTTPGGTATSADAFTVVPAPTITSFTPTSGPVGTDVVINGSNFTGATKVEFGTTSAPGFTVAAGGGSIDVNATEDPEEGSPS
jgi:hypothetical protein